MNIFFIYDLTYCKADEDDPKEAIIYFYPTQASESEWYLLSCQIVGMSKFLRSSFSTPHIVSFDQGKFSLLWSGKYLLALGADSDVESSVLKSQMLFLCGIFCFYHGSITNVLKICKGSREEFLAKLESSWSRYITLSQCFGSMLQFSINALPLTAFKKNSGVVSKASRLLHMCQLNSSVIAGAVFYNSRAIASQLTAQMTNYLSLMSNSNASSPVSNVCATVWDLPPDVQLKYVFLSSKMISKILKFNHAVAGSRIRIKSTSKVAERYQSFLTFQDHLSSGSEGDVDSGNCSENFPNVDLSFGRIRRRSSKKSNWSWSKTFFIKRSNMVFCCAGHWRLWKKEIVNGRNQNCLKSIHKANADKEEDEREDSGVHPITDLKKGPNILEESISGCLRNCVLCHNHADSQAASFTSECREKHTNFQTASDLEFSCPLCSDRTVSVRNLSLKRWNSELNLTSSRLCKNFSYSSLKHLSTQDIPETQKKKGKIQVLKCRKDVPQKVKQSFHQKRFSDSSCSTDNRNSCLKDLFEQYAEIDQNDLQKFVLYVQKYGASTLLLLLRKGYDDKIISHLWNCGFSILRDIEYSSEKISLDTAYEADPTFYMLLYNSLQKVLKEYPHHHSDKAIDKQTRGTVQTIHAHLQSDSELQEFHLLSTFQSIHASHRDPNVSFYVQPECNSRKVDALVHLNKRAKRRLEKIFKISA